MLRIRQLPRYLLTANRLKVPLIASALVVGKVYYSRKAHCDGFLSPELPVSSLVQRLPGSEKHVAQSTKVQGEPSVVTIYDWCNYWMSLFYRSTYLACVYSPAVVTSSMLLIPIDYVQDMWWSIARYCLATSGPCTIKFMQWVSTRPDLFPQSVVEGVKSLQSNTRKPTWADVEPALIRNFGENWQEHLVIEMNKDQSGNPLIVGSGCIAYVLRGKLVLKNKDDSGVSTETLPVAIKITHPGVREVIAADIELMRLAAGMLEYWVPSARSISLADSVEEFSTLMMHQLNMEEEGKALEKFRRNFGCRDTKSDLADRVVPQPAKTSSTTTDVSDKVVSEVKREGNRPARGGGGRGGVGPRGRSGGRGSGPPPSREEPATSTMSSETATALAPGDLSAYTENSPSYSDPNIIDKILDGILSLVNTSAAIVGSLIFKTDILRPSQAVTFPAPVWAYTNKDVLVETYEEGVLMSELMRYADPATQKKIAQVGFDSILQMIFTDNYIHADLHPGNIICVKHSTDKTAGQIELDDRTDCSGDQCAEHIRQRYSVHNKKHPFQLAYIDAGLVVCHERDDRRNFQELFKSIVLNNGYQSGRLMIERSRGDKSKIVDPEGFCLAVKNLVNSVHEQGLQLEKIGVSSLLQQVLTLCYQHQVKLESKYVSVIVAIGVMEGMGRQLDPNVDILKKAAPYVLSAAVLGEVGSVSN